MKILCFLLTVCFANLIYGEENKEYPKQFIIIIDTGFCIQGYHNESGVVMYLSSSKSTLDSELNSSLKVFDMLFEDPYLADCVRFSTTPCDNYPMRSNSNYFFTKQCSLESRVSYFRVVLIMKIETKQINFGKTNEHLVPYEFLYSKDRKVIVKPFFKDNCGWPTILSMKIIDEKGNICYERADSARR